MKSVNIYSSFAPSVWIYRNFSHLLRTPKTNLVKEYTGQVTHTHTVSYHMLISTSIDKRLCDP